MLLLAMVLLLFANVMGAVVDAGVAVGRMRPGGGARVRAATPASKVL